MAGVRPEAVVAIDPVTPVAWVLPVAKEVTGERGTTVPFWSLLPK